MMRRRRRRNPTSSPSAFTLAEAGIIQDVALVIGGGVLVWILYEILTANAGTPEEGVSEVLGYAPGPGTALPANTPSGPATPQNTIPNPSTLSNQNGVFPWSPPGPPA